MVNFIRKHKATKEYWALLEGETAEFSTRVGLAYNISLRKDRLGHWVSTPKKDTFTDADAFAISGSSIRL
jgi:hypothetical protein